MRLHMVGLPPWLGGLKGRGRDVATFVVYAAKRFYDDRCGQSASALAYTSLLALVPVMTIAFAIFTAFPAFREIQEQAQILVFNNLVPQLGEQVLQYISRFTANAGQLTAFGVVGLAVTGVMLLATIEAAFNTIWRIHEPRPLLLRLLAFWALLTVSPLLFGASLSLSSAVFSFLGVGEQAPFPLHELSLLLPFAFEFAGFTLLYAAIPHRTVRWRDSAVGGLTAAVLFEIAKTGFAWYLVQYPAYQTIYGAISAIPIFLIWLYLAWSTVLIGAVVAAALPEWRAGKIANIGPEGLLPAQRLELSLAILRELLTAAQFGVGITRRTLAGRVPVGAAVVEGMLEQLRHARFVERTSRGAWVLSRDLGDATLYDLQRALGIGLRGPAKGFDAIDGAWRDWAADLLRRADESDRDVLGVPLKHLLTDHERGRPHVEPQAAPALRRGA